MNLLRIDGRSCAVSVNEEQYHAVQNMEGMIPMNGQHDNLIDRFDGRALLDFYRDPVNRQAKVKTDDEMELEEVQDSFLKGCATMLIHLQTPNRSVILL